MRTNMKIYALAATAVLSAMGSSASAKWPEDADGSYGKASISETLALDCWGTGKSTDVGVKVEFNDGRGRIRIPNVLIPPVNSGGRRGWWNLYNVRFGRDNITAQYRLNELLQPIVEINRASGQIKIDSLTKKYRGECDVGDSGTGFNRF